MRRRLGELRKAPWTLWAYVGLSASVTVVAGLVTDPAYLWVLPISLALLLVFGFFLLRGSRVIWWLLVVLGLGSVPFYFTGDNLWQAPFTVIELGLLLLPASRRYVFKPKPRRAKHAAALDSSERRPQTSWDPDAHDDASRPPGWYFDPHNLSRMRYWDSDLGGWQSKTTRAPRQR